MKGKLDIVNERFVDVTVASLDEKGCAKLRQGISGSFKDPKLDKVSTLQSVAAPVLGLFAETKNLLTGGACVPFYAGTVAHPPRARRRPNRTTPIRGACLFSMVIQLPF